MIQHSFLYFFVRAGTGVLTIVTLAAFTRLLSPKEYGVYALGMAISAMVSSILFQWLNVAVGRFYPIYRDNPTIVLAAARRGFWCATLIGVLLLLAALPFLKVFDVEPTLLGILFLVAVAQGKHDGLLQLTNSQSSPLRYGSISWVKSGTALLVGFALIQSGLGALGALIGFLAGLIVSLFVFSAERGRVPKSAAVGKGLSAEMLRYGLPLTFTFLAFMLVGLADRFIIGLLLGPATVAPYAAAYDLVQQLIGAIMSVMFLAAYPAVVQNFEAEGNEKAQMRLRALGRGLVCIHRAFQHAPCQAAPLRHRRGNIGALGRC